MKNNWDAVLFDLDGTLVDTTTDLRLALNKLCEEMRVSPATQEEFLPYTGQGVNKILSRFLSIDPRSDDFQVAKNRFLSFYSATKNVNSDFFPGIRGMMKVLEEKGTDWGIVTSKQRRLTVPLLDYLDLDCYCLVCGDDVSFPKPSPDPLLKATGILNKDPSKCIYIGDDWCDYEAARLSGMDFIGVSWGYSRNILLEKTSARLVSSVGELKGLLFS